MPNDDVLTPSSWRFRHLSHYEIILTIPEAHKVCAYWVSHVIKACFTSSSQVKWCRYESSSFKAGNSGTLQGNKSRFYGDGTSRKYSTNFLVPRGMCCWTLSQKRTRRRWKYRKVFSLWPTISVPPPPQRKVPTVKSRRWAPAANIFRITWPWKLGPSAVQINKTLNFSDFDFSNIKNCKRLLSTLL